MKKESSVSKLRRSLGKKVAVAAFAGALAGGMSACKKEEANNGNTVTPQADTPAAKAGKNGCSGANGCGGANGCSGKDGKADPGKATTDNAVVKENAEAAADPGKATTANAVVKENAEAAAEVKAAADDVKAAATETKEAAADTKEAAASLKKAAKNACSGKNGCSGKK